MSFDNILKNIRRFTSLRSPGRKAFCALLSIRKVKRKEFLLREGAVCNFEWYVNTGCFRSYYVDKKGLEHNIYFAIEDWWTSDLFSRTTQEPSNCNIIALEDSEVVQIKHTELEAFMVEYLLWNAFFRLLSAIFSEPAFEKSQAIVHERRGALYSFQRKIPPTGQTHSQKHIAVF